MNTSEIAKLLGISRGTVSRVINNNPNVKPETREMVLKALEEYGYKPNETARSLVMKRSFRIAVILFSEPVFFWKQVEQGVTTACEELKFLGLEVDIFTTDILNPTEQLKLLQRLPNEGYHGLIVAPNDPTLLSEEVDRLSSNGIPVVLINVEIPSANQLCYIGCDYTQAGALAAELMARSIGMEGSVAVLALRDQVVAIDQRITGFRRELAKYPDIQITHMARFPRTAEGVYEEVFEMLQHCPELSGIFVSFSGLEQTAQAAQDAGKNRKFSIIGYDLNQEIADYLKNGALTATICHEPFQQGYLSVKVLYRYLSGKTLPPSSLIYTKLEAVLANNVGCYLKAASAFPFDRSTQVP